MAVPAYEFIDPIGRFAGYQLIPGTPLSPAVFELLSNSARDAVLRAVGQLLHTLHTLDPAGDHQSGSVALQLDGGGFRRSHATAALAPVKSCATGAC